MPYYVELSRVRNPDGLKLLAFAPDKIRLDQYYRHLLNWIANEDVFKTGPKENIALPQ